MTSFRRANSIANNLIKKVSTNETIQVKDLWAKETVVITFLRRFGCIFCRKGAKEISEINTHLANNGVKLVGIGLQEVGVEDFVKGGYFIGDLYIDPKAQCFQDLGYKRYSKVGVNLAMLKPSVWKAYSDAVKNDKLSGNMAGDRYQLGGTMIIEKGGPLVYHYRQPSFSDHVKNSQILSTLGILDQLNEPSDSSGQDQDKDASANG